jgi:proteasome component ECM29
MGEIAKVRRELNFMSDALKIIPAVVEETVDEDHMEIDSKNGTRDDTLAACVQCLLQCFNPTAGSGQG